MRERPGSTSEREGTGSSGRRSWAVMWAWQQPWPTPRGSGAEMTLQSDLTFGWNGCAFVLISCCIWAALGRVEPGARWLCSEAITAGAGSWRLLPPTALQQLGQVRPVLASAALHRPPPPNSIIAFGVQPVRRDLTGQRKAPPSLSHFSPRIVSSNSLSKNHLLCWASTTTLKTKI